MTSNVYQISTEKEPANRGATEDEVGRRSSTVLVEPLQAAGSIFGGLRRSTSQSSHISEGRGAKSIVLNQGLYYIKRPGAYLKAVNNVRFIE